MKKYTVTQVYQGMRDYQHIRAKSREEAIELAQDLDFEMDGNNSSFRDFWFAELEEEE